MASGSASDLDARDMGTSALPGRAVLDIAVVRALSRRSNFQGWMRWFAHLFVIGATGSLIWLAWPSWSLLVPAMLLHGFALVTMFAPMHESVHRTAFASPLANEMVGWTAGLISFYNFTYYRHYHTWHHRFTQDPQRDPELATPKPRNIAGYLWEISGVSFWLNRPWLFLGMALGRTGHLPYVPATARWKIALSASMQLAIYLAAVIFIVRGYRFPLYFWFLPTLLAQPLLRAILIAEHTGCSTDDNGLTNTRTTLTNRLVRLLMWNMPFHTEHHLYPSIPFHQLPQAHLALKERLAHLAPSYVAANREVIESLGAAP